MKNQCAWPAARRCTAILKWRPGRASICLARISFRKSVKQIIAVVKPYLAEKVVQALRRAPLEALAVREVKGYGRQKNYLDEYGQSEYALAFLPKVEIEAWVDDARVDEVVDRITQVARTGRMGDGKVFIVPMTSFESIQSS